MTIEACAAFVQRGDPDRFAAVVAAPLAVRGQLFVLYAWNLEVARAPWVTAEPMIAEMRLQWWRDVLDAPRRAHEVAGPLHDLMAEAALPVAVMDRLIAARTWDVYRDPHADQGALDMYLEDTGAGLMWLAAKALGAGPEAEPVARLDRARKGPRGGAALLAGWQAEGLLRQVVRDPSVVADGRMGLSEFARRGTLVWQAVTGRF
jgi:15-cis-phytoene synthase